MTCKDVKGGMPNRTDNSTYAKMPLGSWQPVSIFFRGVVIGKK